MFGIEITNPGVFVALAIIAAVAAVVVFGLLFAAAVAYDRREEEFHSTVQSMVDNTFPMEEVVDVCASQFYNWEADFQVWLDEVDGDLAAWDRYNDYIGEGGWDTDRPMS